MTRVRRQADIGRALVDWFASLPFVCELSSATGSRSTRRLGVRCDPLEVNELCVIARESRRRRGEPRLYVVMPNQRRTFANPAGWFSSIEPMDDGRLKCRVDLEGRDRTQLEVILLSAYSSTFPPAAGAR